MQFAGIDVNKFKPHSTRAASTSQAAKRGVPLDIIMKSAGWKSETTFTKFYHKPVETQKNLTWAVLAKQ